MVNLLYLIICFAICCGALMFIVRFRSALSEWNIQSEIKKKTYYQYATSVARDLKAKKERDELWRLVQENRDLINLLGKLNIIATDIMPGDKNND